MAADGSASSLTIFGGTDVNSGSTIAELQGIVLFTLTSALNEAAGTMTATSGATLQFEASALSNDGAMTADGGSIIIDNTQLQNIGTIVAQNEGTVTLSDATSSSAFTFANAGMIEASSSGEVLFIDSKLDNAGGAVQAGASSEFLLSNATLNGGTVSIAATGFVVGSGTSAIDNAIINDSGALETGGTFTLDGDTVNGGVITGAGTGDNIINVDAGDTLTLNGVTAQGNTDGTGTTDNAGTIVLENTLSLAGTGFTLLLDGIGAVSLNGTTIAGSSLGETLENNANAISGAGQIGNGNGDLTLQNDAAGMVTAQGGTLNILASVVNDGAMTAASGAFLSLGGAVSGTGSTVVDGAGTVVVGALDTQAVTFEGVGTLVINPTASFSGAIDGLVVGDVIDFANNTSITSTSISSSTLTVNESSGGPLTYQVAGALTGNYFAIQSDNNGGDELVFSRAAAITETLTGTLSGTEHAAISLAGLAVADATNPSDTLTTVLTVTSGTITAGGQTGATVTLTGTAAAINTALSTASYTGNSGFHGSDTLTATTTDGGGVSSGAQPFTITVADTAAITETLTGTLSGTEHAAISLAGLAVADATNPSDTLTTVLTVTSGTITAGGRLARR